MNACPTCSFAPRPLRASPVSPRRAAAARRRNAEGAEGAEGAGGGGCSSSEMAETVADTRRLITKPQNLNDAYGPPSNFLEIDVSNPQTVGVGRGRFTTYEIRVKVRLSFPLQRDPSRRPWSPPADPGGELLRRPQTPRPAAPADSVGQPCPRVGSWTRAPLHVGLGWGLQRQLSPALALVEGAGRRGRGLSAACPSSS